jgi:Gas vesicle protein
MADVERYPAGRPPSSGRGIPPAPQPANLADILERVLDKGIVIAGDIQINLVDIELLTIKLRLLVASVDKAREMGIDWWEHDPALSSVAQDDLEQENADLRRRLERLERRLELQEGDRDDAARGRRRGGEREGDG